MSLPVQPTAAAAAAECGCAYSPPQLMHDPLTGLYNKHGFVTRGNQILRLMAARDRQAILIYLELSEYDGLISRLGYDASLVLLSAMRRRMEIVFGREALLARFDSERFAALLPDGQAGIEDTIRALEAPLHIDGTTCHLSLSCGVATFNDAGYNMDMLIIAARSARQDAQRAQRQIGWYADGMRQRLARQRSIEDGLWFARNGAGLSLVYQPKIDIRAGKVIGVEALLRWHHPELGAVSPAEFIPLAERTRAILPIGEWLLREALHQKCAWRQGGQDIRMSINVSPLQLGAQMQGPTVLDIMTEECRRLGLRHDKLEIEITEGLLSNAEVMAQVREIAGAGFGIAVDDFGREHSALSLLVNCPATTLKIDKSFVDDVVENDRQLAVVHFIVALARRLGMETVVEGIEHLQQLVALADAGCDYGQGYFYYRPLSASQIMELRHSH
ncbi:bifunctional diguanylate cyclase/phosphodiesterase [Niveispirillum sp.]|uniref:putative bifunctional diguanylate cyclase/phosphodiesterase n=1 Tax=Niveispirillum sp. TaxID=1917217 RepID=UPI001B461EF4|nr:bifunctional diguanylate cyclase/phosphodiesterase [Niveispirillum sp.]MBP7337607.1 bifunctional diguanylate cyclase/phosphodiesterase [Niveispirillum sp.]